MNAQPHEKAGMSSEEYLENERTSEIRHEYFDGEIFAMTGASLNHNRIQHNISRVLGNQLLESSCDVLLSDQRIKIETLTKYTYPDIAVVCGEIKLEEKNGLDTLLNPIVIIEILSDSTEAYDRGKKFQHYRLLPSLREYVLVSQYFCSIEKYLRGDDDIWLYSSCERMEQRIKIEAIDCELLLSDIYYRVQFG